MLSFGPRYFVNILIDQLLLMKDEVSAKVLYLIPMVWDWGRMESIELGKLYQQNNCTLYLTTKNPVLSVNW